jgi:hypothetical protein
MQGEKREVAAWLEEWPSKEVQIQGRKLFESSEYFQDDE